MEELFQMSKGREFQVTGAATEKLRDPKPVQQVVMPWQYHTSMIHVRLTDNEQ